MARIEPAHYERGAVNVVERTPMGPSGGEVRIPLAGLDRAGLVLDLPPGAVSSTVTITVSYDDGALVGASGDPARGAIVVEAEGVRSFAKPVTLQVSFPATAAPAPKSVAGYSIEEGGSLQALDMVAFDPGNSSATFSAFRPVTFTWVYIR